MGVVVTIAVVLVAWCVCALVVGVVVGRAIALRPPGKVATPEPRAGHTPDSAAFSVSRPERR